jgi:hypothetical protein
MAETDWKQIAAEWRKLPSAEQRRIRLSRIPRKVARSMAFEGEPVDETMLEDELQRLMRQRALQEQGKRISATPSLLRRIARRIARMAGIDRSG